MTIIYGIPVVLVFLIACDLIGSIFNRTGNESILKKSIINIVLGMGILSYIAFFIGFFTTRIPYFFILIVLAILVVLRFFIFKKGRIPRPTFSGFIWFDYLLVAGIALILTGHYLIAVSPNITWDAATHHYLVPMKWLEFGRIKPINQIIFSEYPSTIEMLYMIGYQFAGEWIANLVNWMISILMTFAIYRFIAERYDRRCGLIGAVVFLSMPLSIELFTGGMIDMGYALFCFMSFWMFITYRETDDKRNLFLSAVFAGFALGSKHLAMEYLAALFFGVLISELIIRKKSAKSFILDFVIIVGIGLLIALPWYIKSYLHTGNPIHPFLPGLFHKMEQIDTPISVHAWSRPDYKRSIFNLLTYPWKITNDFTFFDFWVLAVNPLFLGTIPLWWYFRKKFVKPSWIIILYTIIMFVLMAYRIAPSSTRYMLPILCIIVIPTALSLNFLEKKLTRHGQVLLFILLFIPFIFNFGVVYKRVYDVSKVLVGIESKDQFYTKHINGYDSMNWINQNMPEDILILSTDPKVYFLHRPFLVGTSGAQSNLLPEWTVPDTDVLLEKWHEQRVTHLLFNLSRNVMKNSYFVYAVTVGIDELGEVLMTEQGLREFTQEKTGYLYKPGEIAEFGRFTRTPTKIINGEVHYHLYREWWEPTVGQDKSQYMLRHYFNMRPHLKEIKTFKSAVLYEIQYDLPLE